MLCKYLQNPSSSLLLNNQILNILSRLQLMSKQVRMYKHINPRIIQHIACDSFVGTVYFNWQKSSFRKIMHHLGFICASKNNNEVYTKKIKFSYICSMSAYPNGTLLLNGCHSYEEMEDVVMEFIQKMGYVDGVRVSVIRKLEAVSFRAKVQFANVFFDINSLSKFIYQQQTKYQLHHFMLPYKPQNSKIMLPQFIHNVKKMRVFVVRIGYIQIYKANLVPNLYEFATKLFQSLLKDYLTPKMDKKSQSTLKRQLQIKSRLHEVLLRRSAEQRKKQKQLKITVKRYPKMQNNEQDVYHNSYFPYTNYTQEIKPQLNERELHGSYIRDQFLDESIQEHFIRYQFEDQNSNKEESKQKNQNQSYQSESQQGEKAQDDLS